jgi:NodT family efflux transporter outer membrane factor (OMF) lipoprotein
MDSNTSAPKGRRICGAGAFACRQFFPRLPTAGALFVALSAWFFCGACLKLPPYQKPTAASPAAFKEQPPEGWKNAQPADGTLRGKWWEIFNDPALNALEEQVNISNQNILAAEAQFRVAKAAVRAARSALSPTVTGSPSAIGSDSSSRLGREPSTGAIGTYTLPADASYTADFWGSIHRTIASSAELAQASDAQLENARLLYQTELASDYFQLHGTDGDIELLDQTANSYKEYLTLTKNRYDGGVASDSDVAQAETQLYTTQAELVDLGVARAQFEHAIAVLVGKSPAELTIPPMTLKAAPPVIPVGVPSALLERRPDIADSERQVASANEQIGIAKAAFYPTLTLAVSGGLQSTSLINWLTLPSRFWSIGPTLAQTLFDAGKRKAQVASAEASYDATAANYRQTVLTAFQQVEDNLAALRILESEAAVLDQAVKSAERSLAVSRYQYTGGIVNYLQVITTQSIALTDEKSAIDLLTRRMTAAVQLIQALGGGWDTSKLSTTQEVSTQH